MSTYRETITVSHTRDVSGEHNYNPDLVGYVGGHTSHCPYPDVSTEIRQAPPRGQDKITFRTDEVGIIRSSHEWKDAHSYINKQPTLNKDRFDNLSNLY